MTAAAQPLSPTSQLVADLYQRHERLVRYLIRSRVRHQDAEDLEQDVWLAALVNLPRFRGMSRPQTWLVRIALNAVFMWGRRRRYWRWEELTFQSEPVVPSHQAEAVDLSRALHSLAPSLRTVLVWHDAYGLTHREIARHLCIVKSTSVRRLARARRELKAALAR